MPSFAADAGSDFQSIEIDADDGVDGVDEREGVGAAATAARAGITISVMLGVSLTITGILAASITQRVICSQYSGTWPTARPCRARSCRGDSRN